MTRTIATIYLIILGIATNIACTQFLAGKFGYHAALGNPLYQHYYSPFDWWSWAFRFYDHSPMIYTQAFGIFITGLIIAMVGLALILGKSRTSKKHPDVHGTAHYATLEEVRDAGLLPQGKPGEGAYVGGFYDPETDRILYLRYDGDGHVVVIGRPRSGKGTGNVTPNLLSCLDSFFINDIKGENYAISSGWRKKAGQTVLRFEPGSAGVSCAWNALEEIRFKTRDEIGDTQDIAIMLIDTDGKGVHGDHWKMTAFELLSGVILHALYKSSIVGRMPGISDCALILREQGDFSPAPVPDNERPLHAIFTEMSRVTLDNADAQKFIRGAGTSMLNKDARELSGVISTANTALSVYLETNVAENTSRSDFRITDLMDSEKPVSLYFIRSPKQLARLNPLARLLLTQIVLRNTDRMEFDEGRAKTAHKHRLRLMLDEFATFGRLEVFQNAMAYMPGYGIQAYIILQDIQQLKGVYGPHETILANCDITVALTPNNPETAEWLSKRTGQTTVITEQISTSGKRFGLFLGNTSTSYHQTSRYLMTPNEVARMPLNTNGEAGKMLIFATGLSVIYGTQIRYYVDPVFSARSKIPPPETSGTFAS
jgi:type IV secretion system protein VirD4